MPTKDDFDTHVLSNDNTWLSLLKSGASDIAVFCRDRNVDFCREDDFQIKIEYEKILPSGINGTDLVTETISQKYDNEEAFLGHVHF